MNKKRRLSGAELAGEIKQVARGQYIKEIIKWEIKDSKKGVSFRWWFDKEVLAQIKRERLGKKILFTDNDDWDTRAIIAAYHGQYEIEHAFRQILFDPIVH